MTRDPLTTLLRLRQTALDEIQRALGDATATEHEAEATRRAAAQAIVDEARYATDSVEDHDVERFARWLKVGRARLRIAEQAVADAAVMTTNRRAELALARAAAEATSKAIECRNEAARLVESRATQRDQDEIGLRRRV